MKSSSKMGSYDLSKQDGKPGTLQARRNPFSASAALADALYTRERLIRHLVITTDAHAQVRRTAAQLALIILRKEQDPKGIGQLALPGSPIHKRTSNQTSGHHNGRTRPSSAHSRSTSSHHSKERARSKRHRSASPPRQPYTQENV
ncbi:uncharacterized protein LOC143962780 [Lithobates pipiens]